MYFKTKRKYYLEQKLESHYELLNEWEIKRDLSENPTETAKCNLEIEKFNNQIKRYEFELEEVFHYITENENILEKKHYGFEKRKNNNKLKLVIFSGTGVSALSGVGVNALKNWKGYDINELASIKAWHLYPQVILEYYNERRKKAYSAEPNEIHHILSSLQTDFDLSIITPVVDNLHERAGINKVVHLHGEIFKSRSTLDANLKYDIEGYKLDIGDKCKKGSQLRPDIVWFGENLPMFDTGLNIARNADLFIAVGNSFIVYPASNIIDAIPEFVPKYIINNRLPSVKLVKKYKKEKMYKNFFIDETPLIEGLKDIIKTIV